MTEPKTFYTTQAEAHHLAKQMYSRIIRWLTFGRLATFLSFVLIPFFYFKQAPALSVLLSLISLSLFIYMVKLFLKTSEKRRFSEKMIALNNDELLALEHKFTQFSDGKEFIDPDHFNSYDLDLFGTGSLFQFINRTVTLSGKEMLANWLQKPLLSIVALKNRQQFVSELSRKNFWRQRFQATGKMYDANETDSRIFERWKTETYSIKSIGTTKALLVILPVFSLFSLGHWIFSANSALFVLASVFQFIFWVYHLKNINLLYRSFGKKANLLMNYGSLFDQIENETWEADEPKLLIAKLKEEGLPSVEFRNLWRTISAFDNRNNMLVGIVLNLIFVWDVRCTFKLAQWHKKNKENFHHWNNLLAFFDAATSLANFAYNNHAYVYPQVADGVFSLNAKQIGHPLIHAQKRIGNHFEIDSSRQLVIVTGANMAGKSTFLRTVGVNMVLGMAGAPVCAQHMSFKPVEVFSNMRTTDSLFNDESYFFAELKRLKMILDEVDKGRELLIILDEILKGTNSVDKLAGSQKLVQRLIENRVPAIVATHDLKLTEMETKYPEQVKNQCFEITIANNEMHFDYQLRPGATTIMNATFLMRKMGIIS